ncbi:MAG TPA: 50S ribosomal protein L23 [Gaiellaceae bacterium]|nr:50S ribosomal protein L23 [Gaiellaceae bacterium]
MSLHPNEVLLEPVVTEKAYAGVEVGKYAFRVHPDAHKTQIRQAVEQLFEVKVERVNVSMVQPKPKRRGVHRGTRPGWKKAVVQLRAGDTIELFGGVHA